MGQFRPHARDLRKGRLSIAGQIYFVTAVTQNRAKLFEDFWCGRILVNALRHQELAGNVSSLAFTVMPDHFHWLFQLRNEQPLHCVVSMAKSFSAREINKRDRSRARVWQAGYHDHALRRDGDLVAVARYLVANPLRAGLVQDLGKYPLWDAVWM